MTIESACESSLVTLNYDSDYEINTSYPHQVRKKSTLKIISEFEDNTGYMRLNLNRFKILKHRIIALQFIPNDDPETKIQIDHINRDKLDNRIENLRWVTAKENLQNKSEYRTQPSEYINELPENSIQIEDYNDYEFEKYYYDIDNERVLMKCDTKKFGTRYKIVKPVINGNGYRIQLTDLNKKQCRFHYNKFIDYHRINF